MNKYLNKHTQTTTQFVEMRKYASKKVAIQNTAYQAMLLVYGHSYSGFFFTSCISAKCGMSTSYAKRMGICGEDCDHLSKIDIILNIVHNIIIVFVFVY